MGLPELLRKLQLAQELASATRQKNQRTQPQPMETLAHMDARQPAPPPASAPSPPAASAAQDLDIPATQRALASDTSSSAGAITPGRLMGQSARHPARWQTSMQTGQPANFHAGQERMLEENAAAAASRQEEQQEENALTEGPSAETRI